MKKLKFVYWGRYSAPQSVDDADFAIENRNYSWDNWGYKTQYHLWALPHITGKEQPANIGLINIVAPPLCMLNYPDHALEKYLIHNELFESLSGCVTGPISDEMAKKLFVLLTPEQRKEFVNALNMVASVKMYNQFLDQSVRQTIFRFINDRSDKDGAKAEMEERVFEPMRKWLFNETNFKELLSIRDFMDYSIDLYKELEE